MANNIALTLTVNGTEQVIETISDLELAIRQAKEELGKLKIGSAEFDNLRVKVRQADNSLKNLQETIEGKKLEETIGRYAKIGAGITGSFAAAQAALQLFGEESDDVAKAAADAQSVLTIALVGREVAEAAVAGATLIADVATKAQTASTLAADGATKKFYATLAANPYTALLIGVSLLITAIVAFGGKTDEAKKKSKEFADQVNKDSAKEITATKLLIQTVNDSSLSIATRQKAIDDLRAKFPAYFQDLKDEDILSGKVKIATQQLTEAIIKQAQARAIQGRIEERAVKLLEVEEKLTKATKDRVAAQTDANTRGVITGGGSVGGLGGAGVSEAAASQRLSDAIARENKLKGEKSKLDKENLEDGLKILKLNQETDNTIGTGTAATNGNTKAVKDNTNAKDKNVEATKEQIALQKQLEQGLNDEIAGLEKAADAFRKIAEGQAITIGIPKSLEIIRGIRGAIDGVIPTTYKDEFKKIGLDITFLGDEFKVLNNELVRNQDTFGLYIETIREDLTTGALRMSVEDFGRRTALILNETSMMFQKGLITKEAFEATDKLISQYQDLNKIIKSLPEGVQEVFSSETLKKYLDTIKDIDIATGKIRYEEEINGEIVKITNSTINLTEKQKELDKITTEVRQGLVDKYTQSLVVNGKLSEDAYNKTIDTLVKTKRLTEKQGEELKDKFGEYKDDATKLITDLSEAQVKALNTTVSNIIAEETQIREFLFNIQEERIKGIEKQTEALPRVVLNNLEALDKVISKRNKVVVDETKTNEEQTLDIKKQFADRNIDLTALTQEEIDKIIQFYINKQNAALDTQQQAQIKRLESIRQFITEFTSVVGQAGQTLNDYFAYQTTLNERRNADAQSKIVEDTKRGTELRLEQEEIYQRKKKQIEKQAAKTALGISLIQATANVAEAITKSLSLGPAGAALAIVSAGIGAVQVGLIAQQISQLDQYKRGGIVRLQGGGMVVGPSHEYGGVKYQGGGIELEGGEAVINRMSSIKYQGLLSQINMAGGGKPVINNNFDDSRIVEALGKQRSEPIRAYVVESDITNKQAITSRLERLAQY
jgi:hypothetical protein